MFMFVDGLRAKEAAKKQEAALKQDQKESPDAQGNARGEEETRKLDQSGIEAEDLLGITAEPPAERVEEEINKKDEELDEVNLLKNILSNRSD
jgi:hypothetical protein